MHEAHAYGAQGPMHCFGPMESLAHTSQHLLDNLWNLSPLQLLTVDSDEDAMWNMVFMSQGYIHSTRYGILWHIEN